MSLYVILAMVILSIVIAAHRFVVKPKRNQRSLAKQVSDSSSYKEKLLADGSLPDIDSQITLKAPEVAYWAGPAILYESRVLQSYQKGVVGTRVVPGIHVHESVAEHLNKKNWEFVADGYLVVTNKRLFFRSGADQRSIELGKVISIRPQLDGVQVEAERRIKNLFFRTPEAGRLAVVVELCSQVTS